MLCEQGQDATIDMGGDRGESGGEMFPICARKKESGRSISDVVQ